MEEKITTSTGVKIPVSDIKPKKNLTTIWHEGMDVWYWKNGDSFVFSDNQNSFCISRSFLVEIVLAAEENFPTT